MLKRPLTGISELDSSCESFRKSQDHLTWMGWSQNGPHSMVPTLWFQNKVSDWEIEWGTLLSDPDQSMMNCCSLVGGGWIVTMFFSTLGRFYNLGVFLKWHSTGTIPTRFTLKDFWCFRGSLWKLMQYYMPPPLHCAPVNTCPYRIKYEWAKSIVQFCIHNYIYTHSHIVG